MKLEEILPEIRKGRGFRRKFWTSGIFYKEGDANKHLNFGQESLVADDWELEPIKKEISFEDLAESWDKNVVPRLADQVMASSSSATFKIFASALGFK